MKVRAKVLCKKDFKDEWGRTYVHDCTYEVYLFTESYLYKCITDFYDHLITDVPEILHEHFLVIEILEQAEPYQKFETASKSLQAEKILRFYLRTRGRIFHMQDERLLKETYQVFVVWQCKTLKNWKCILCTDLDDEDLYELTYNGNKGEWYVDYYYKLQNVKVKASEDGLKIES